MIELQHELRTALRADPRLADFLLDAGSAGVAYWDLRAPPNAWLGASLCAALSAATLPRRSQGLAEPDPRDVESMLAHAREQQTEQAQVYPGVVRWRVGETIVATRCRTLLVRAASGEPLGVLAAHTIDPDARGEALAPQSGGARRRSGAELDVWEVVESLPQFVWTCKPSGECDYLSPQWLDYTGIPESEQLGYGWLQQVHPDDREPTRTRWAEAAQRGGPFDTEFRIRRHDGEYRWFKTRASPLHDPCGRLVKWLGSNTDVQDLRDAQDGLARANSELEARVAERTRALQEAIAQLELAQSLTHVGSWRIDVSSGAVEWSNELHRIAGREGQPVPDLQDQASLFLPASWERLSRAVQNSVATGEGYEIDIDVVRPSGEVRSGVARARAVRGPSGHVTELLGTFHDATELVLAQRERDASAERLRLATSAARMGIWDWDIRNDKLVWDDRMYEFYGLERMPSTDVYFAWRNCVHPDDVKVADLAVKDALEGRAPFDVAFRVLRPDGRVLHLRAQATVFRDEQGAPVRMIGVNWDVTAERETELALRSNQILLDQFVRYAPAAIAMLDTEMRYLHVSERWLKDYEFEGQDLIGRSHYEVFPELPERWKEVHRRVLAGAVESCADDPFPRSGGRMEWLQWEARPWRKPDGSVGGAMFFTQMITARKRMELTLQTQKAELERSNRELEQFAYAASHDLQEPLRAVAGCAQILARKYRRQLDEEADTLIGHMVDGAERMRTLITDLLAYSRVSSHGGELRLTDTAAVVRQALANLHASIAETGAEVAVGELPLVKGDAGQLAQVFQNLLGNAIKYRGAEAPRIAVRAERRGESWQFSVKDNGIGIERAYFERIFELFQRLHTRSEYPGTGIGLALCQKIVQRHGGRIWVESQPGQGSTFFFTVPAQEGAP